MSTETHAAAVTIAQQIGHRALFMFGAKNLISGTDAAGNPTMSFKVGRNSKKVTHIRVSLVSDLYNVEFLNIRGFDIRTVSQVDGVYADGLIGVLESHTGMYASL